jgi:hypothetical protein
MATIAGFPYREVEFNDTGCVVAPDRARQCVKEAPQQKITDLFVYSHGWNNDYTTARKHYQRFFEVARGVLTARVGATAGSGVGIVGVLWQSILFPDDQPQAVAGGAAGLDDALESSDPIVELKKVFADQRVTLDELGHCSTSSPKASML